MATHAANAETGSAVASRAVPVILPTGPAVGLAAQALREVAAGPTTARTQVLRRAPPPASGLAPVAIP